MLGVIPFVEDPDLSGTASPAVPQHLPPCLTLTSPLLVIFSLSDKYLGINLVS